MLTAVAAGLDVVRDAGLAGVLLFAAAYVIATLLLVPGAALTAAAGALYGVVGGAALVAPLATGAATLAFLASRAVGRRWRPRFADDPRTRRIQGAVQARGFRLVLLLRLSPIVPFNLLNYALGATRIDLRSYVAASFVGMLPGTLLYVYLGAAAGDVTRLAASGDTGTAGRWLFWLGLAATLAAAALLTRSIHPALRAELEP